MKKYFLIVGTALFLGACCSESDFEFTAAHHSLYKPYSLNDTVYFQNAFNDLDTMIIVAIDSSQECGAIMVGKSKVVSVEIQHLPNNRWTGGTEISQDGIVNILNQELIVIEKDMNHDPDIRYYIGFEYREFNGEIENINQMITDSLFSDLGVNEYWMIKNDRQDQFEDSVTITKMYWTQKFGLTGYYSREGGLYRIKYK